MARGTIWPLAVEYVDGKRLRGEISKQTAYDYLLILAGFDESFGNRPLSALGQAAVERWLERAARMKESSRRTHWSRISAFLDWLAAPERQLIKANPCRSMRPPRVPDHEPRTITPEQFAAILAAAPDARARAILHMEYGMAARRCEVNRARVEHWYRRDETMLLLGKGNKERVVPVPAVVAAAFDAYLREHPATSGPLFRPYPRPWLPMSVGAIGTVVRRAMLDAGVKAAPGDGLSGHALRRSCASDVLDACGDLRVVQELLGHANIATTSRSYLRRKGLVPMREALEARGRSTEAA